MKNELMLQINQNLPEFKAILGLNHKGENLEALAMQELEFLKQIAISKPEIAECIPLTIIQAVKQVLKKNLSLDPSAGLVYVKTRNVKIIENGKEEWKKALEIQETANGIISVARQCGRVLDVAVPWVTKDAAGKVIEVTFDYQLGTGRWERRSFDESDFSRWAKASHTERSRGKQDAPTVNYANPLYYSFKGGLDPEFARAKCIRHGLKKLGTNPNEQRIILAPTAAKPMIDPSIEVEEVEHQQYNESSSQIAITTHEIIQLPNPSDL